MIYNLNVEHFNTTIDASTFDGVIWKAEHLLQTAGDDIDMRTAAIDEISLMLGVIPDAYKRDFYTQKISEIAGSNKKTQKAMASNIKEKLRMKADAQKKQEEKDSPLRLPADVSADDYYADGMWYASKDKNEFGCWFAEGNGDHRKRVCQFVVEPLYATMNRDNMKLIMNVEDIEQKWLVTMPIDGLLRLEVFQSEIFRQCRHFFHGTKQQLMRIGDKYRKQFADVYELSTLGWQPEGFFAFFNKVYVPAKKKDETTESAEILDYTEHGLVQVKEKQYYSPAISIINQNVRGDDDFYKKDRLLAYYVSDVTFEEWSTIVYKVYPDTAWIIVGGVLMAMVRDIIFKMDNNCPLISFYGPAGSGKSKAAETMAAVFTPGLQPFNLNHGTDAAFFRKLAWACNIIGHFDEFDYKSMHEERLQSIKGSYDGVGRERMRKESRNATEIMEINCMLVLTGQYLCNWDDNSILSRAILKSFLPKGEGGYTQDDLDNYDRLKMMEKKGLTSIIVEGLEHRGFLEENYHRRFSEVFQNLRERVQLKGLKMEERIVRNYTAMYTVLSLFSEKINMPWKDLDLMKWCVDDICTLTEVKQTSDVLSSFWDTVAWLVENRRVIPGLQFKIKTEFTMKVSVDRNTEEDRNFGSVGKRILYIRLDAIHPEYMKSSREQTGKNGIDKATLRTYFKSTKAFIGNVQQVRFRYLPHGEQNSVETVTSAYAFDYDLLGIFLETIKSADENSTVGYSPSGGQMTMNTENTKKEDEMPF